MDTLTFIAKLIEFLAWPVAAVVLVALLRSEIKSLLPFIKKLKAGPLEAEFERELRELRKAELAQPPGAETSPLSSAEKKLLELVEINPRSAILEAWRGIETATKHLPSEPAITSTVQHATGTINYRAVANYLSLEDLALYHELRSLRNQAAHDDDLSPTKEAALNFVQLSNGLRTKLERRSAEG